MNSSLFVPQRTAALLLQHWRSGDLLTELPASLRPETLKQGYDSQDQFFAAAANNAVTTTRLRLPNTLAPFFTRRSQMRPATMVPNAPNT